MTHVAHNALDALDRLARDGTVERNVRVHDLVKAVRRELRTDLSDPFNVARESYLLWRAYALTDEHYKSEPLAETWINWRGFCGCGDPSILLTLIRDGMEAVDAKDLGLQKFRDVTQEEARWLLMYVLDQLGLSEHGTSVRGAWPTEDGKVFLGDLRRELAEPPA